MSWRMTLFESCTLIPLAKMLSTSNLKGCKTKLLVMCGYRHNQPQNSWKQYFFNFQFGHVWSHNFNFNLVQRALVLEDYAPALGVGESTTKFLVMRGCTQNQPQSSCHAWLHTESTTKFLVMRGCTQNQPQSSWSCVAAHRINHKVLGHA